MAETDKLIVLVTGSRTIDNYSFVKKYLVDIISKEQWDLFLPNKSVEIVSGHASSGADLLCERVAKENKIPVKPFPANWSNLNPMVENVVEGTSAQGRKYNKLAGINRNTNMVEYAAQFLPDAICIAFDAGTPGTKDTVSKAKKAGLKVYQIRCKDMNKVKVKVWNE